jgi:hypothetical protein
MKNIRLYAAPKYSGSNYTEIEPGIYKTFLHYDDQQTSLSLQQLTDVQELAAVEKQTGWKHGKGEFLEDFLILIYKGKTYYKDIEDDEDIIYINMDNDKLVYVTSLVFEQEPEYGENEPSDRYVSQYPLEDILDKFYCICTDDYPNENESDPVNSYYEFASDDIEDIRNLMSIIGMHVYNVENGEVVDLVIEDVYYN